MSREHGRKELSGGVAAYIKGAVLGIIVTAVCILVFAAVMLLFEVDRAFAAPFATVSIAAGTLVAAFYTARKIGDKGYLVGLITGFAAFAIVTLISLAVSRDGVSFNTLFHLIIIMLAGIIGGIWGVNQKANRKYI